MENAISSKLRACIRNIPDFPKSGIMFRDLMPILGNASLCQEITDVFSERYSAMQIDAILAIEARGFLFGAFLSQRMNLPLIPVRKPGKLPPEVESISYTLEYGEGSLEIQKAALRPQQRVLLIDDLLATGGTAKAAAELAAQQSALVVECAFVTELDYLEGREMLAPLPCYSLVNYQD